MAITLQTIESLPLVEEVNENTSLVGWDGEKTVRIPNVVTYNTEDQKAGKVPVSEKGVLQPHIGGSSGEGCGYKTIENVKIDNELIVKSGNSLIEAPFTIRPIVGATYNVTLDGTTYTCTAYSMMDGNSPCTVIGDPESGDTFAIIHYANGVTMIGLMSEDSVHTISIEGMSEIIHQIPSEYIPMIVVRRINGRLECNVGYNEFCRLTSLGVPVTYVLMNDDGFMRVSNVVRVERQYEDDPVYIYVYGINSNEISDSSCEFLAYYKFKGIQHAEPE